MPKRHSICQFVSQQWIVRIVAGQVVVFAALALMFLGSSLFTNISSVSAASCTGGNTTYVAHNHVANSNLIYADQHVCGTSKTATTTHASVVGNALPTHDVAGSAVKGTYNNFPYGQCTWWADQRYFQLTGIYVPWIVNSNANVWTQRALQYNWKVSTQPTLHSIMMLTPGVQGAFSDGHVAVVEKLLGGGRFQVSQMNWNGGVGVVSYGDFTAASGVYFISYN
jgi:surface antigen